MEIPWLQILVNGLSLGLIYALLAVGLTIIFGVGRIINFAHGEFYMLAAFLVYSLVMSGLPYLVSILLAMLMLAIFGVLVERGIFRPIRENMTSVFVASVGLSMALQVVGLYFWGGLAKAIPAPWPGTLGFFGALVPRHALFTVLIAGLVVIFLWLFFRYHKEGLALRAAAQDRVAAELQGVSINKTIGIAMALAAALAAMAGGLLGAASGVHPFVGFAVILKALIVVLVGGLGSVTGSFIAAIALGLIDSTTSTLINPAISTAFGVAFMVIVLAVRPQGLMGEK